MKHIHFTSMIRLNTFALSILTLLFFSACTTDPKDLMDGDQDALEEYYEFQGFDLSAYDIPATIMLPDETANIGASTKPEVIHTEDNFYWDINVGPNFQMHIEDFGDNKDLVSAHKKSLKQKDMFEITYLIDEDDIVLYERKLIVKGDKKAPKSVGVEHRSYHVYGQKTINGINYELRSREEGYEKVIIELMAKSVRSLDKKG